MGPSFFNSNSMRIWADVSLSISVTVTFCPLACCAASEINLCSRVISALNSVWSNGSPGAVVADQWATTQMGVRSVRAVGRFAASFRRAMLFR